MNAAGPLRLGLAIVFAVSLAAVRAEEMVTIPKSRLEELERKEKELNALQGKLDRARGQQEQLRREKAKVESEKMQLTRAKEAAEERAVAAVAKAEPVVAHDTPPLAGLPPLKKGDVVDAMDLMNHYRADAVGAVKRYGKQRIRVRGVVTGFEKPLFVSHYFIFLRTTDRSWPVRCVVDPPREFTAVYDAQRGETLVGVTSSGARLTLLRAGQTVEIEGNAKDLKEKTLTLGSGRLMVTE